MPQRNGNSPISFRTQCLEPSTLTRHGQNSWRITNAMPHNETTQGLRLHPMDSFWFRTFFAVTLLAGVTGFFQGSPSLDDKPSEPPNQTGSAEIMYVDVAASVWPRSCQCVWRQITEGLCSRNHRKRCGHFRFRRRWRKRHSHHQWHDLEVAALESPPALFLYKNDRNGRFAEVSGRAGLTQTGWAQGVCVGDYDNDGDSDFSVTYYGHNRLFNNQGRGTFVDATTQANFRFRGPVGVRVVVF